MMRKTLTKALLALSLVTPVLAQPAFAATTLSAKEQARVARAPRADRAELRQCLIERKKGQKKGTIAGAAGGGATVAIGGGNVGKSLLGAGVGALAGNVIGKEVATSKRCHALLKRNP